MVWCLRIIPALFVQLPRVFGWVNRPFPGPATSTHRQRQVILALLGLDLGEASCEAPRFAALLARPPALTQQLDFATALRPGRPRKRRRKTGESRPTELSDLLGVDIFCFFVVLTVLVEVFQLRAVLWAFWLSNFGLLCSFWYCESAGAQLFRRGNFALSRSGFSGGCPILAFPFVYWFSIYGVVPVFAVPKGDRLLFLGPSEPTEVGFCRRAGGCCSAATSAAKFAQLSAR